MPEKWQRTWSLPLGMEDDDNTPVFGVQREDLLQRFISE